ncbi:unnamed protein product [Nesidiocoris tenuis]|uniref:Galactose mutarotase n=1 Tax=Nesidiocoris tenuis TaxID=355587 RepID=A0A6H5GQT3_9HEMI|nr:unnamed protein product [Nesidiocoris tenuis]
MAAATSVVLLDRGNNTTCTINLHGATVVSWRVNNQEQLFVSKAAIFDGKAPIRGGIPVVFPHFGPWSYGPNHGFARVTQWGVEKRPERLPSGDVEAIFFCTDNEWTRSIWHYQFRLTYRLILREKRTRDMVIYQEGREAVTIGEWTDRIYQNTPQEHIITNVVSGRKMRVQKYNFPDTVVWNPWLDHSKDVPDLGEDEYPNMICVESGHVSSPVVLLPGTAFEASQILQGSDPYVFTYFFLGNVLMFFKCSY